VRKGSAPSRVPSPASRPGVGRVPAAPRRASARERGREGGGRRDRGRSGADGRGHPRASLGPSLLDLGSSHKEEGAASRVWELLRKKQRGLPSYDRRVPPNFPSRTFPERPCLPGLAVLGQLWHRRREGVVALSRFPLPSCSECLLSASHLCFGSVPPQYCPSGRGKRLFLVLS